ncbi:MAG: DUF885 domain-containing protein [Micrococcales bacterium]|nr:DUF885 domain-containing protein [Micrococcales bacterium]
MTRQMTPIDELADQHFDATVALSPMQMTWLGIDERQDEYDDMTPDGIAAFDSIRRATLKSLDALRPADDVDATTVSALRERIGLAVEQHGAHADLMDIAGIDSGLSGIREVYDLMPTDTAANWATIGRRLQAVPAAIDGWFLTQLAGIEAGVKPAIRQVKLLAEQCDGWVADGGYFDAMANNAARKLPDMDAATRDELQTGLDVAKKAFAAASQRLTDQIAPLAVQQDAAGPQRYELASRHFLGMKVDFQQYYQWGQDELARIEDQSAQIAAKLRPGMTVAQTKKSLDEDPAYVLDDAEAMRAWLQSRAETAIAVLNGVHFDIPEPARHVECMFADNHDGGVWYTAPSDDFSRPGRMWWSVPEGQTTFSMWRELTTVHHEGVPGHHLQCAQAVYIRDILNKWRRNGIWVSGHGEGWALYAEQLMAELGYMDDPAHMLGMLDGQAMRAVRVVIDMGLHCGFDAPAEVGGGEWTFDKAWTYFNSHVEYEEGQARFEVLRYFGWPGQAPAYKIGERVWQEIRDECKAREGDAFSLKAFHAKALNLGSVGLQTLKDAMLG